MAKMKNGNATATASANFAPVPDVDGNPDVALTESIFGDKWA